MLCMTKTRISGNTHFVRHSLTYKYTSGVTRHNPGLHRGGFYAEGVRFHSPGSRRGEAAERTLGHAPHNTRIRRRRYTNDGNDVPLPTRSRNGTATLRLCNAFDVWGGWIMHPPRVRCERRSRRIAATLGYGVEPCQGSDNTLNTYETRAQRRNESAERELS